MTTTKEIADQNKDEQYILDELAYAVERNTWFEINGRSSSILQSMLKSKDAEIERLREALRNIASKNPFHNQCPPINDVQFYSQIIVEMVGIANAALKEKE